MDVDQFSDRQKNNNNKTKTKHLPGDHGFGIWTLLHLSQQFGLLDSSPLQRKTQTCLICCTGINRLLTLFVVGLNSQLSSCIGLQCLSQPSHLAGHLYNPRTLWWEAFEQTRTQELKCLQKGIHFILHIWTSEATGAFDINNKSCPKLKTSAKDAAVLLDIWPVNHLVHVKYINPFENWNFLSNVHSVDTTTVRHSLCPATQ